jgi:ubiquinone biosynthesis protein COQ9
MSNRIETGPTETGPTETAEPFDRDAVREKIVEAALPHVPFDGWTLETLRRAAQDAGYEPVMALRVFSRGPVEAIEFWNTLADRRMLAALEQEDVASLKIRAKVALAVRRRLEAAGAHREAVRRALGLLSLPHNAPVAAATVWRTIDAIWYAAGDTATDFNYYTKRGLLAGVYSATVLYWLEDKSEGQQATWEFLDRRIADVMRVPQALGSIRERLAAFPNPFKPFFAGRRGL